MFYLNFNGLQLVGASPELLVRCENGLVETRPIAGTRPRGSNEAEDASLMKDLLADRDNLVKNLKKEVDDTQKTVDTITDKEKKDQDQILTLTNKEQDITKATEQKIATIQSQKDIATQNALDKESKLVAQLQSASAIKRDLTIAAAILAVLSLAAAVFSPLLKRQFIEFGVLMSFIAMAIPFVEPWMVGVALGIGLLIVLVSILMEHKAVVTTAATAISAVTSAPVVVAAPAPITVAATK